MNKNKEKLNKKLENVQMNTIIIFGAYMVFCMYMNILYVNLNFLVSVAVSTFLLVIALIRQSFINKQIKLSNSKKDSSNYMRYNKMQLLANNYFSVAFSSCISIFLFKPYVMNDQSLVDLLHSSSLILGIIGAFMLLYVILGDHKAINQ